MKVLLLLAFLSVIVLSADQCPETLQVTCIDDIRKAYPVCQKAAAEGGSDMIADIACFKYFTKIKSQCWPCVCEVAKFDKIKVKGC